jgi:hypothetical protein
VEHRTSRFPVPQLTDLARVVGANPRATVYLSERYKQSLVCPTATPTSGSYVEMPPTATNDWEVPDEMLGERIWEALLLFRKSSEFGPHKLTDWPAYKASRAKTVRDFEAEYVRIIVVSFPCVLRLEGVIPNQFASGLFVGREISNACDFEDLGALLRLIYRCALRLENEDFS